MASLASFYEPSLLNPYRVLAIALESLHTNFEGPRSKQSKDMHVFPQVSFILRKRRNVENVNIQKPLLVSADVW